MPTSIREQCLSAFFDLFAGLSAYPLKKRMSHWDVDPGELPALVQVDGGGEPLGGTNTNMHVDIRVSILAGVRVASSAELGSALSAAHADILAVGANKILLAGNAWTEWTGDNEPIPIIDGPPAAVYPISFTIHTTQAEGDPFSF